MTKKQKKPGLFDDLAGVFDDLIDHDDPPIPIVPPTRQRLKSVIMFWREEKCQNCRRSYEGSAYGAPFMLQTIIEKPIMHFGKCYGWRFHAITYTPLEGPNCYPSLPRDIQTVHTTIQRCRRCAHHPKVIYLPQEKTAC